jgi:GNAT superfamily N-acetyltransferase
VSEQAAGKSVRVAVARQDDPAVGATYRDYMREVVGRYWRRDASDAEVDDAVAAYDENLSGAAGAVLLARVGEPPAVAGCVGVRWLADGQVGEVTRLFVDAPFRRHGVARALMGALESLAVARGAARLRLDTRDDLVEARALYASLGFVEVAPFSDAPYAEHWFVRELG